MHHLETLKTMKILLLHSSPRLDLDGMRLQESVHSTMLETAGSMSQAWAGRFLRFAHPIALLGFLMRNLGWLWFSTDLPNMTFSNNEGVANWIYYPGKTLGQSDLVFDYAQTSWMQWK